MIGKTFVDESPASENLPMKYITRFHRKNNLFIHEIFDDKDNFYVSLYFADKIGFIGKYSFTDENAFVGRYLFIDETTLIDTHVMPMKIVICKKESLKKNTIEDQ